MLFEKMIPFFCAPTFKQWTLPYNSGVCF